jgi:hypothetical protein
MATIYYEITYGDDPFIVNITGEGIDITQTKWSTGTYYFTGLEEDGYYVITIESAGGCVVSFEVAINCFTTTTTTSTCYVYAEMVSFCEEIIPTTTTSTTNIQPTIECLEGLVIEAIYMRTVYDYELLSPDYVHPCYPTIGTHDCNRALFELYGNGDANSGVYIGDLRMNNAEGSGGGVTIHSGNNICEDYHNHPDILTGGLWSGTEQSRYDRITLTYQQALDIATASPGGGTIVDFYFLPAMITYGTTCYDETAPHSEITWIRISKSTGEVIYNGCPEGGFLSLDVCTGIPVTTTSTTIGINTLFVNYDALTTTTTTTLL